MRMLVCFLLLCVSSLQTVSSKILLRKTEAPLWIFCAAQWQECVCNGKVRWGNKNRWKEIEPEQGKDHVKVMCSINKLGDLLPGDDGKHCQCLATPGTKFFESINPGLMTPEILKKNNRARMVASCDQFEAGAKQGHSGALLWKAVEAFCSEGWRGSMTELAGKKAIDLPTMKSLMRAWVEPRFAGNYERIFNKSGWAPRAFVNYYAGAPGGTHARLTEELIRSVHLFSKEPIIVVHYGFFSVNEWSPEEFPRLVLLNAAPLPTNAARSFHFNKFRAMLFSRVLAGIELDSDQFVAPGIDSMFQRTEEEVTKEYPFPILPVHFWAFGPRDQNLGGPALWKRYCPSMQNGNCKWQTQRWGHAHPTWTYWALPFVGRWLRRNFRDEHLPERHNGEMRSLRVIDVTQDEDLFNVATWEEGGKKQWCKFDMPDPSEFDTLLDHHHNDTKCKGFMCGNIGGDVQFYKDGAAKVFFTAHHAVNPDKNKEYINKLVARQAANDLAPPIMFHETFYKTGADLSKAHPNLGCLV